MRRSTQGVAAGKGIGQAVGERLLELSPRHGALSLVAAAARLGVPVTVHVAIGTDIIHMHPAASGAALGEGSLRDFRYFVSNVARLRGGVYLNCGSAVVLPEVFLKAVALVRNRGISLDGLTTVNLDFMRLYRPQTNVVSRPTAGIGKGYSLVGHHEIMIPLLAAASDRTVERCNLSGLRTLEPRVNINGSGGVAQLVRACGSYPQCPGFKSLHRHHFLPIHAPRRSRPCDRSETRHAAAVGGRVLVALSGGPDSVGLLHLLCILAARGELTVAGVGASQPRLARCGRRRRALLQEHAAELGIPVCVERADVRALAKDWRTSLEDAGRRARYAFLERAAAELGASAIATGHTLDDQAETFLLQLIRGAGPRGLSGIGPNAVSFAGLSSIFAGKRSATWLAAEGLPFREDESNRDLAFTRNRVRHRLLPLLERRLFARDRRGARPRVGDRTRGRGLPSIRSNRIGAFRRLSK